MNDNWSQNFEFLTSPIKGQPAFETNRFAIVGDMGTIFPMGIIL